MKNFSLLILILFSWTKPGLSQSDLSNKPGNPFITNWSPKEYNAHQQNWKIVQDKRGVMYFANGQGVLEYDGVNWRTISLPNDSWALSLAFDSSAERIYVGAETEFGYLSPDSVGEMHYISLMPSVPVQYRDFGEVWETLASSHGIYFRSSKYLFRWKNSLIASGLGDFKIWKPEHSFNRAFLVTDILYVHQGETGLMELANDSLRLVPGGERFFQERIIALLSFDNNKILVFTRSQGQFIYDGQTFQPFITQADAFLQENQLYHGAMLADGTFALATLRGGLAIMDKHGRLLQIVNKISGLIDDNIWFLYPDREGALWLALNNGLARVEIPAPLSLYSEQLGIKGLVVAVLRHQNRLYAATSEGVYFLSSLTDKIPIFQPISGISTAAWSFLSVDNTLLAATHQGIFRIEGDRATQRMCDLSSYCFYRSRRDPNLVYVGLDDGLGLLQWQNDNWFFSGPVQGISGDVRSIVEDEDGILWLGTSQQGVLRVKFLSYQPEVATDKVPAVEIERFTEGKGIPKGSVRVSFIKNRVRIATYKGMRMFEPRSQSFIPDSTFGKIFADTLSWMNRIIEGYQERVLIRLESEDKLMIGEAIPQEDGTYKWNTNPFARFFEYGDIITIYPDPEYPGVIWFGGEGIIVRYDPKVFKNYSIDYHALIRRVTVKDSVIFGGAYKNKKEHLLIPKIDYSNNNLRFEFAAPYYDGQSATQYQILLDGFDKTWSEWTNETKKDYTNLPEGEYHFRVRAKNLYNHLSSEAVYSFKILPPWWRTWWAYVVYILILGLLIFMVDRIQRHRLVKKERERAEIRETKLRSQAVDAENKMLQSENERKELELRKATELKAAYTELKNTHENLKATQQQLVTQQKLASLGALTAGIAHEIKNPLNFVNNFSEVSRELLDEMKLEIQNNNLDEVIELIGDLKQNLDKINQHGKRADSIVKGMLLHSRGTSGEKTPTDINDLLDQYVNLAYHGMRAQNKEFNITIEKDYDETLEKINVVPQDISRVFLNIINNACYAANEKKKKSGNSFVPLLKVSTRKLADKVEIRIGDNGNGIPADHLEKIFQPFFTTKPSGEGTGLGLSLSYDIVTKMHGGELKVETKEGEGTTFIISLPLNSIK
ncbi:MAG: ATP-binding protein [Ignavibacteriota bacterium]